MPVADNVPEGDGLAMSEHAATERKETKNVIEVEERSVYNNSVLL